MTSKLLLVESKSKQMLYIQALHSNFTFKLFIAKQNGSICRLLYIIKNSKENFYLVTYTLVYDRNHLFGLGSDTETGNWPKLLADTETNRNHKILNWKALHQGACKKFSCHVNYQNIYSVYH